jgi:two-component system response regulator MtrA
MFGLFRRKPRVLILDDDVAMQKLMKLLLEREGFRAHVVSSGRAAIAKLKVTTYHAILLDLMMPHEGGMTVIRHLRENDPAKLKRVIIVTGTPKPVLKAIAKEVAGIVPKPFAPAELIDAVRRLS